MATTQRTKLTRAARREIREQKFIKKIGKKGLIAALYDEFARAYVDQYTEDMESYERGLLDADYESIEDALDKGFLPARYMAKYGVKSLLESEGRAFLSHSIFCNGMRDARPKDTEDVIAYLETKKRELYEEVFECAGAPKGRAGLWDMAAEETFNGARADCIKELIDAIQVVKRARDKGFTGEV